MSALKRRVSHTALGYVVILEKERVSPPKFSRGWRDGPTSLRQTSSPHNAASSLLNVAPIHHLLNLELFHQQEAPCEKKTEHVYLSHLDVGAGGPEGCMSVILQNVEAPKN